MDSRKQFAAAVTSACGRLETSIKDALVNKKLLESRMDRLVRLKREVELKEKSAEEAKEEAAISGFDILAKVEALKQAQQSEKARNDKHASEVNAQRAALAKDLKELEIRMSRVLSLGRTSLGVSDEMHSVLKKRLTKAVEEKELADKERLEVRLAQEALAFEESQMLELVKRSETLKQEELENSKLQDLFKRYESDISTLNGDVCDNYRDLKLFMERLDQPIQQLSGLSSSSHKSANLDSEEQEENMNDSFEVKSAPVEVGHLTSTEGKNNKYTCPARRRIRRRNAKGRRD